jgi:hypothetical protein
VHHAPISRQDSYTSNGSSTLTSPTRHTYAALNTALTSRSEADADAGAVVVAVTDSDRLFVVETLTVIVTEGGGEGEDVALAVALADTAASVGLSWPLLVVEGEAGVLADAAPPMLAVELAEASAVTVEHGVEDCETSPTLAEAVGDAESRDEVVGDIETVIVTEAPTLPLRDTPLVALLQFSNVDALTLTTCSA